MNYTIFPLFEKRGLDGNLYAFGRVIEPEPADQTIYELEQPIPIDQPHVITFDLDPATVRALHVDATFTYGGPLKPGTRCPLIWLTWDDGSEWKKTTAPLYVFVLAKGIETYVLRSLLRGEWIGRASGLPFGKIAAGETIRIQSEIRSGLVDTLVNRLVDGESVEGLIMSEGGISSPFGDVGMRLQIGHRDVREDEVGDEELPPGSILKSLRVWSE